MRRLLLATTAVILLFSAGINAQPRDEHRGPMVEPRREYRAPVIQPRRDDWKSGTWLHDYHDGQLGWWWIVNGTFYFYSAPVYPAPAYPVEVAPLVSGYWYYCRPFELYYPYTQTCPILWELIPR